MLLNVLFQISLFIVCALGYTKDDTVEIEKHSQPETLSRKGEVTVEFNVKYSGKNQDKKRNFTFSEEALEIGNITIDQLKEGWVQELPNGTQEMYVMGMTFPLEELKETLISYYSEEGNLAFEISLEKFNSLTIDDIKDDHTLVPLMAPALNWTSSPRCKLKSFTVNVSNSSVGMKLNEKTVISRNVTLKKNRHLKGWVHVMGEGLVLTVFNPGTCQNMLEMVALTSDVSGYHDLLWALDSIQPGMVVFIASLRDGAAFIPKKARKALHRLGSLYVPFYQYRDTWMKIFVKGGKVLHEALSPNQDGFTTCGSPMDANINAETIGLEEQEECVSWPTTERWKARRAFCDSKGGFARLCDCEKPFEFQGGNLMDNLNSNSSVRASSIPILILTGNRSRQLFHLFETLGPQENVTRDNILLISDGYIEDASLLAFILDLRLIIHEPEGSKSTRISRNLRFGLFNGLQLYPNASAFIVLEDDLLLSPDFYSFMTQMEPIFGKDDSIYCVSAFNHISYAHTSMDPTLTYRVESYPAYGWMMPRGVVEYVLPRWLPSNFTHDWDRYVGSDLIRDGRECVVPDINRSYHWSTSGYHNSYFQYSYDLERLYLSRTKHEAVLVKLQPLERLRKENYEAEMRNLLNLSTPVPFSNEEDLSAVLIPGKVFSVFVSKKNPDDFASFRLFGEELSMWNHDGRDHHNSAWRLFYKNATILVIGVPLSPYSSYMPKDFSPLVGNSLTDAEISLNEPYLRAQMKVLTHANFSFLPRF